MTATRTSSRLEAAKRASDGLRGRLAAGLADPSPSFDAESAALLAFHGIRQSCQRDGAAERARQGLGAEYQFTLRLRLPAGLLSVAQYLALDDVADRQGDGTLRLVPRQGIELPGVLKRDLKEAIVAIALARLTTFAAGGDVARAAAAVAPGRDGVQRRLEEDARRLSHHLLPRSGAYDELWLEGERAGTEEADALYGAAYLPHKLEIGLAVPEDDAVDVRSRDLALLAHGEEGRLAGYTMALGGSSAAAAAPVAFIEPQDLLAAAAAVVALFRDQGDRSERRRARLGELIARRGAAWAKAQLEAALGKALAPPLPLPQRRLADHLGWHEQGDGRLALGLAVPGGRIADGPGAQRRAALRLVCKSFAPALLVTPQDSILLGNIAPSDRLALAAALGRFGVAPDAAPASLRDAS